MPLVLVNEMNIGDGRGFVFRTVADGLPVLAADKIFKDRYDGFFRRKLCLSVASGCNVECVYCFTKTFKKYRPLTEKEIIGQTNFLLARSPDIVSYDEIKVSYKQMGDPAFNVGNVCRAIRSISSVNPRFTHVISTSGPRNTNLFEKLAKIAESGIKIRLQFSCHTTSDEERAILSPTVPMMTIGEIAKIANAWKFSRVTLNFVFFDGFTYDPLVVSSLFDPERIFVKLNYIDHNSQTANRNLENSRTDDILKFAKTLSELGFISAFRHKN